jgi:hypothetical protein
MAYTLADADRDFPETMDGSVYSDTYKDIYGVRPRGKEWASREHFEQSLERLWDSHDVMMNEEPREVPLDTPSLDTSFHDHELDV